MMTQDQCKKGTKLYFRCGCLEKRCIEINSNSHRGKIESIGKNLDIETKKKVKLYFSYFA